MPPNQATKRRHRPNGDGSVYKRKDGYWVGAFYARTTSGARKRVVVYGKTLAEARDKLSQAQHQARAGIRFPTNRGRSDRTWSTGWRISSNATGAQLPMRCMRRSSASTSSRDWAPRA